MQLTASLTKLIRLLAVAAISLLLYSPAAEAALPYNDGDIFLGFRATGGDGATTDYLLNIGSATQFTTATARFNVNIGPIVTDLVNTYGTNWKTRADVFWSISGVQSVAGNGVPNRTMFATALEPLPGTQSTPWARPSSFAAGVPVNKMAVMAAPGYAAGATPDQVISPTNPKALLQSTNAQNSYASFQPGGANTTGSSAFSYFLTATGIEGSFAGGTAGSILDFYKLETGSGPAALLGAFKLEDNGTLTFSPDISFFAPAATVVFDQPAYSATEDIPGGQVAIKIMRVGNAGSAFSVNFSTTNDSAVAGRDFTGQTNVPVSFAINETTKTVNVEIARNTGYQGNRQFNVALSSPTGNVILGLLNTATVAIVEVDPAPPSVAFGAESFSVNEDAGQVEILLTRLGESTAPFSVNFSTKDGTAIAGTDYTAQTNVPVSFAASEKTRTVNVAVARRTAFQGNREFNVVLSNPTGAILATPSSTTVTIAEIDPQPATLVFGEAAFTVAENVAGGVVAIVVNRAGVTTAAGSVTFSTANGTALTGLDYTAQTNVPLDFAANEKTKTINVAILDRAEFQGSRKFTVTLSNPTNGGVLGTPASAEVTITDKEPPGATAGNYRGLITPTGAASNETSGTIALTVTSKRAFTGKLMLGGGELAFSGKFDETGAAKFKPGQAAELALKLNCDTPLDLGTLTLNIVGDVIDGVQKNPEVVANVHLERDAFDGKTPQSSVDPTLMANAGRYTVVIPSKSQEGLEAGAFPQGDGIGFITLKAKGKVAFTGKLADGKSFSAITRLAKNYTCPVYVHTYKMLGSFAGTLTFKVSDESDLSGTDFLWVRPIMAKSVYYPAGWPAGVKVDVMGASYNSAPETPSASVFPGLSPEDLVNGNASIEVSDGKLAEAIVAKLNISAANAVTPLAETGLKIKIARETGKVTGKFTHSDGARLKFNAVIYQKGTTQGAFGYFLSAVPEGGTGEGGGVSLTPVTPTPP